MRRVPPESDGTSVNSRWLLPFIPFAFLLFFLSCEFASAPNEDGVLPAIEVPWNSTRSIVCFGTSLTSGFTWELGPTPVPVVRPPEFPHDFAGIVPSEYDTISYPARLSRHLRISVHNQGILGLTTLRALQIVGDSVFARRPALVLLELGANDLLRGLPVHDVSSRLERLVDTLQQFGSRVVLISFLNEEIISTIPSNHFLFSRREEGKECLKMLRQVAAKKRILFVEDAMKGIYWNASLLSDALHPNAKGYAVMEANIRHALARTFQKNQMWR